MYEHDSTERLRARGQSIQALLDQGKASPAEQRELARTIEEIARRGRVRDFETRGGLGGSRVQAKRPTLSHEQRMADWLKDNWHRSEVSEGREYPASWDRESTGKLWKGTLTGNWRNAEPERRAALAEGASATGGYLVPAPVAAEYVDLLRDKLVFMQGQSHTVPWDMAGSTLSLPVAVTDIEVQNLSEGTDLDPPSSDVTFNKFTFVARPYAALEKWSWELESDSAVAVSDIVMHSFVERMMRSVQADFCYGGGANTIQGLAGLSGLKVQYEGGSTPPVAPTSAKGYTAWDNAIQTCRSAKSDVDMIVGSPLAVYKYTSLQNTLNDALRPSPVVQGFFDRGEVYQTTAIKDGQTVGTDTSDVSDIFFLNSSMVYWAIKHQMSVLSLRERFATARLFGAVAWLRLDAIPQVHAEAQVRLQVKTA